MLVPHGGIVVRELWLTGFAFAGTFHPQVSQTIGVYALYRVFHSQALKRSSEIKSRRFSRKCRNADREGRNTHCE